MGLVDKAQLSWHRLKCALMAALVLCWQISIHLPSAAPALPQGQTRATSSGTDMGQPPEPDCCAVQGVNSSPEGTQGVFAILGGA